MLSGLLVRVYSGTLYAPFSKNQYALCFGCHDQSLATQERTTIVTKFRNGETNLHFVHVNRDRKGRTCSGPVMMPTLPNEINTFMTRFPLDRVDGSFRSGSNASVMGGAVPRDATRACNTAGANH